MDTHSMLPAELDGWEVLKRFLPAGWQEQAKALGAFQRSRKVKDPESLLRLLLIHVAGELAALYAQRWEIETALGELKTHLRGQQIVLRSKTPTGAPGVLRPAPGPFRDPGTHARGGAQGRPGPRRAFLRSRGAGYPT